MQLISDLYDQLRKTVGAAPASSRVSMILIAALFVFGLVYGLANRTSPTANAMLFGGRELSEQELDTVEMAFSAAGLNDWNRDGRRISVPTDSRSEYLAALDKSTSVPISIRSSVQDAIEKSTIFETSTQRQARQLHAKELDLGNKLAAFPDIRSASVEYDMGERHGLGQARPQSASVVVIPEGMQPLTLARTQLIKDFIRGSFAGMSAENVVVIDTNASNQVCSTRDPLSLRRVELQKQLQSEIQQTLAGFGEVRIQTFIELETGRPATPDPIKVDSNSSTVTLLRPPLSETSSTRDISRLSSLLARRIRVSVGIPESYFHRSQDARPSDSAAYQRVYSATHANIQSAVTPITLNYMADSHSQPVIELWEYPDAIENHASSENLTTSLFAAAMQHWQSAAFVLLAGLIASFMLSGVLRKHQNSSAHASSREEPTLRSTPPQNFGSSLSSDEELIALINNDPDAAAEVIRDWIYQAA